ncbi:MAG: NAD-dependent epimerase/dehydratase family protein [Thermodesulfobacteriota bacterium]
MNVFITGIRGFIAGRLNLSLQDQGYTISGSTSKTGEPMGRQPAGERIFHHKLGEPVDEAMFIGMDTVIHCAHDFQKGALKKNVEGTIAIAEAADKQGVGKQIFISSLSSRPDAQSEYGKAKFEIELYFKRNKGIIIRPGTVLGNGGIFGKMVRLVKGFPVVPLLDGGNSQMYVIGVDDLCRSIYQVTKANGNTFEYNLYYPEKVTLKEILMAIRRLSGRHSILVPVPAAFLIMPLSFLNSLGIKLPVDIDNLRGFIKSQTMIYQSDLQKVLHSYMSIEDILKAEFD